MANLDEGYEDNRFEKEIDRDLHCPICMNVLKDPKMCQRNQHYFCSPCIRRHLEQNSTTCPICIEELTPETLVEPPRIVTDMLGRLEIRCDYERRGCPELVQLEFLKRHVVNCEYSPTLCGNDGCAMIINKKDEEHHETEVCGYRKVKCEDCGELIQHKKYNVHGCVTRKEVDKVKVSLSQMKTDLIEVRDQLGLVRNQIQQSQQDMMNEMRAMMAQMRNESRQATEAQHNMRDELGKMIVEVKEEVDCIKQATALRNLCKRRDIIVAGGTNGLKILNSVEMFDWSKRAWEPLQPMKLARKTAASFVHERQLFVTGGATDLNDRMTETIESMNVNQEPKEWIDFAAKLPFKIRGHRSVVYQNRVIVTGGKVGQKMSNGIYEVPLNARFVKLLHEMPLPLWMHGTEIIGDKIIIFGGMSSISHADCTDVVMMYDINNNVCKKLKPLPFPVTSMASVSWKDNVILLGGVDRDNSVLNSVIMYNVTTEEFRMLPSMKYKRLGCAGVITGNVIVVVGGKSSIFPGKVVNHVECFDLDRNVWEELPPLIEARRNLMAVVKPSFE